MKDSFVFYKSFYEAIHRLKDKSLKADIFEAICELALNENNIELNDDVGAIIMSLIKPQILANNERYENGKKGGAPKGNQNAKKTTQKQVKQPMVDLKNNLKQPNVNVNVNDNDNDNEIILNEFNIYNNFDQNFQCDCITKTTNEKCNRKSTWNINGKNYCNQHSKDIISKYFNESKENIKEKHTYGEFQNVLLSDEELEKLKEEFIDYELRIEKLSNYIASKGVKYKSHYATILSWARNDKTSSEQLPNWYGKEIQKKEISEDEKRELEEMLKELEE